MFYMFKQMHIGKHAVRMNVEYLAYYS
jgi:hypothetical protein